MSARLALAVLALALALSACGRSETALTHDADAGAPSRAPAPGASAADGGEDRLAAALGAAHLADARRAADTVLTLGVVPSRWGDDFGRFLRRIFRDGPPPISPGAAEESLRTARSVAADLLSLPDATSAGGVQRDALTGAVEDAACSYLFDYLSRVEPSFTLGRAPDPAVFWSGLSESLATFGTPAENQLRAISERFGKLHTVIRGAPDAREAAFSIGCSVVLPG